MSFEYSLEETKNLARVLAEKASLGECYCLRGDLGSGKTEFARAFIRAIAGDVKVSSPTFNIVQTYGDIFHFDLYRLKSTSELAEIGIEEALAHNITLIEWPQIAEEILPERRTEIRFEVLPDERRKIIVQKLP